MNENKDLFEYFDSLKDIVSHRLIEWYRVNKRSLPWRETHDPYKIWISEIILQQTRVDQGLGYYLRFIDRFPDVNSLAAADEDDVLKYWQGLGYYSRARNLHAAAQTIVEKYNGVFPSDYDDVLQLKGIGEYTAAAIVSFAWNKPYPAVDGNVFRFISRLLAVKDPIDTGKGKKLFTGLAQALIDDKHAGLFNQAIMEFGALQCVPVSPACPVCPFADKCFAYAASEVENYPVKQNKTKTQDRYLYYFHIREGEYTYIKKRTGKGIWQNLYEFPMLESEVPLSFEDFSSHSYFKELFPLSDNVDFRLIISKRKHVLSHRILYVDFYEVILNGSTEYDIPFFKIKEDDINNYPVHRLMQFYLEK